MDQQQHGNFIAFMNRDKQPGDNKPTFDGRLAIPGTDTELRFALWGHEYESPKGGKQIMLKGQTDAIVASATPMEQVAALIKAAPAAEQGDATFGNLKLAPRQLVLFPNGYRAASSGAEVDLVLEPPGGRTWAVEIRRSLAPTLDRGFYQAHEDLEPSRSFVVYPGAERYFLAESVEVIGVAGLASLLAGGEGAADSPEGRT